MNELAKQPKRRWLRFSLRAFAIAITILCVWIGWYVYRVEQQREAVRWVLENSGGVLFDNEFDSKGDYIPESVAPAPYWLMSILDVNYFSSVTAVVLHNSVVTDVTPLANLTKLKILWLVDLQISDLTPLANLTNLESLTIGCKQVSDEEIERLQQALPNCDINH